MTNRYKAILINGYNFSNIQIETKDLAKLRDYIDKIIYLEQSGESLIDAMDLARYKINKSE